jgi:hypothetical protein
MLIVTSYVDADGRPPNPNEARNLNQTKSMTEAVTDPNLKTQSPLL